MDEYHELVKAVTKAVQRRRSSWLSLIYSFEYVYSLLWLSIFLSNRRFAGMAESQIPPMYGFKTIQNYSSLSKSGPGRLPSIYKVVYPYDGQLKDELTIRRGDLIEVSKEDDDSNKQWTLGMIGSKKGLFYRAFTKYYALKGEDPKQSGIRKTPDGFKVHFIGSSCIVREKPGDECECIVCMSLAHKAHQTNCCGHTLCQECAEKLRKKKAPCPNCREGRLTAVGDARIRRHISGLTAYCPHYEEGCNWKGSISKLPNHLEEECSFEAVSCPCCYVKESIAPKSNFDHYRTHQSPPKRLTYKRLHDVHATQCQKWPMRCPNHCGTEEKLTRSTLQNHIEKCSDQLIPCQFAEFGCNAMVKRKEMANHEQISAIEHLTKVMAKYNKLNVEYNKLKSEHTLSKSQSQRPRRCFDDDDY
jgi:hypothetical protein